MKLKLNTNIGMLLLGIWLILTALPVLLNYPMGSLYNTALLVLAVVAGVCLLIGR